MRNFSIHTKRRIMSRMFGRSRCSSRRIAVLVLCVMLLITFIVFQRRTALSPLYVVEEHHEALLYWFHAIDNQVIPSTKNTLIHIDGHSDESTPQYIPGVPRFRYPKDEQERAMLIQRNDVFIQAAVMSGIISRVIWIWPSWDLDQMVRNLTYQSMTVQLGWFVNETSGGGGGGKGGEDTAPTSFCQCEAVTDSSVDPRCSYVNVTEMDAEKRDVEIHPRLCRVVTTYRSERVNEVVALQRLKNDDGWLGGDENVIVDIDEDFFGCESASREMVGGTELSWKTVEEIDAKLQTFLCPKHIEHESASDEFLRRMAHSLDGACSRSAGGDCTTDFRQVFGSTEDALVRQFLRRPSMFCGGNDLAVRDAWHGLAGKFYNLTSDQFKRIIHVGFCLSTSPKALSFTDGNGAITICHGINEPDSDVVFLHTPSALQVTHRVRTLREILRSLPRRPKLATLCRSVRDGYTPRNMSERIEREVLKTFVEWEDWDVLYDDDLLGGRDGWAGRPTS